MCSEQRECFVNALLLFLLNQWLKCKASVFEIGYLVVVPPLRYNENTPTFRNIFSAFCNNRIETVHMI